MDRRTMLAVLLSLGIWYGWIAVFGRQEPQTDAATDAAQVDGVDGAATDGVDGAAATDGAPAPALVAPAPAATEPAPPARTVPFTMCGTQGEVSTDGGRLHAVTLPDHTAAYHTMPLYRWIIGRVTGSVEGPWHPYGEDPGPAVLLSEQARTLSAGAGPVDATLPMSVVTERPDEIALRGTTAGGLVVDKTFRQVQDETSGACEVQVDVRWSNPTGTAFDGPLWIAMADHTPEAGSRYTSQRQPMALVDGSVRYGGVLGTVCLRRSTKLSDTSGPIPFEGPVTWFGLSDRYFGTFLVPADAADGATPAADGGALRFERLPAATSDVSLDGAVLSWDGLAAGASRSEAFTLYLGPNQDHSLTAVDESLGRAIDLGWFAVFGYPLLWLLRAFHSLLGNWGLSIILLTFVVKLVFFPMTQKSFKSMQGMQKIQPELAAIKEKYADNPQEVNRRTLELMQEHGVNPLSGCLPMIVQMPVWFALYQVLLSSVELYHTRFLYLKDLTEPDPYCILPLTITFLMWLQQQFSTPSANMDPVQQQVMRYMPLVFGFMFFGFPSGLAVYVFVNMTLSNLQQWVIRRSYGAPAPAAAG
ncbi:MAG: membrane protein insertase YidC [Myxococcota bacterium]